MQTNVIAIKIYFGQSQSIFHPTVIAGDILQKMTCGIYIYSLIYLIGERNWHTAKVFFFSSLPL